MYTAVALGPSGMLIAEGPSVAAAVRAVVQKQGAPRERELSLPPWVASEARLIGAKTRAPSEDLVVAGAMTVLGMQGDTPLEQLGPYAMALLLGAFDFISAAPWTWIHGDDRLEIEVGGRRLAASVLGMGGETYGLALYRDGAGPGMGAAQKAYGVFLEKEPALVARALAAIGVEWVPLVFSPDRAMTAVEVETLVAALAVTTKMGRERSASGRVTVPGLERELEARATVAHRPAGAPLVMVGEPDQRSGAKVGRNDPCPCGSGQKYKKCCLTKEAAGGSAPATEHQLDARLLARVQSFADATWPGLVAQRFEACPFASDAAAMASLGRTWVLCHAVTADARTPLGAFLDAQQDQLRPDERAWAAAQARAHLSLYEVVSIEGAQLVLRDRLTREDHRVYDVGASRSARPGYTLVARLAILPDKTLVAGSLPHVLLPIEAEEVRAAIERRLRKAGISRTATGLRAEAAGRIVLEESRARLEEREPGRREPPTMQGGSAVEEVSDVFDVVDPAAVERQLELHPATRREEPNRWCLLGPNLETTVFRAREGTLTLRGNRLTAEPFSRANADRVRAEIERLLGSGVRHRARAHRDLKLDPLRAGITVQALVAEVAPTLEFVRREQDRLWLGQPLPALDGRTPRESMSDAKGRKKLEVLLKERALVEAASPGELPPAFDLRAVLGLAEGGRRMAVKARVARLPKLSEVLLDWILPLSPRTAEDAATPGANARFERVAAATVMLWNATLADTSDAAREHVVASLAAEGPWDRAALDRLVARRLRLFADDLRRVEHHEVRWSGGEPGLGVTFSHPIK